MWEDVKPEEEGGKSGKLSPLQGATQGLALSCLFANFLASRVASAACSLTAQCIAPSGKLAIYYAH